MSQTPAELVFVGGTGRSGTHILSYLLDRHSRFHGVPIECRFHCNPKGLADVVNGEHRARGLRRASCAATGGTGCGSATAPTCGRSGGRSAAAATAACTRSSRRTASRKRSDGSRRLMARTCFGASRTLFYDLLQPLADEAGKPVLVEMSCFTIAAADGLARIFPEARFVHSVRDGRDSGSSKVSLRQKPHHPTDVVSGIEFWADRLRQAEEGVRGLSRGRPRPAARDQPRRARRSPTARAPTPSCCEFLGVDDEPAMREFFDAEMSADAAHRERWRKGLDEAEQAADRRALRGDPRRGSRTRATTARRSCAARTSAPWPHRP